MAHCALAEQANGFRCQKCLMSSSACADSLIRARTQLMFCHREEVVLHVQKWCVVQNLRLERTAGQTCTHATALCTHATHISAYANDAQLWIVVKFIPD